MKIFIIFLLSPAVIHSQQYVKNTNPNDEPFLPIHPEYPYNPKLMKRGIDHKPDQPSPAITQLHSELYVPKIDSRDSYSTSYTQSSYPSYSSYVKPISTSNILTPSSYYPTPYTTPSSSPYGLVNPYSTPYSSFPTGFATNAQSFGVSPYNNMGVYPNYYPHHPYYYPNYYNQPPYGPIPPGYPSRPLKHQNHDNDEEDNDDDRPREKIKKNGNQKNRLKNSDRESDNSQYIDGTNYIISSSKDLDGESSTHRIPSRYNQIEQNSDSEARTAPASKTAYRLVKLSSQPSNDYNSPSNGYIKIQQLEQLMRQALAKLLAQNAAQQENLARIQQEVHKQQNIKNNQHYIPVTNTIAKTGLSYVVSPMILNRVNPVQSSTNNSPYSPSALPLQSITSLNENNQSYPQKSVTSVTLQQSPGIYIPPGKISSDQSPSVEYGDYDSSESVTVKAQESIDNFQGTVEPTRKSYLYSTYRPTQQTNLEDINFGNKEKAAGKT
ncbi:PREDICTED: uncharacterized protein LOC105359964 [Ceratosolen solmsi marchali]|uniref:Uncharacterized protein LOC105359964 n=1 Tax=Ceratosolen solmsi marchali TaxID=326594 RepID=A0AAJ6VM85_9HYME|nr:PREDICTED: uncharacterized protein LOC105359964 [Ceratosolen solmsi marchali]